jgi:polysaccharide export outer membrane protein
MLASLWNAASALADGVPLPPQTNVRVTIIQWITTKGQYEKWDALGGDFQVSEAGTLSLPLIGTVDVGGLDPGGLSTEIANRLKAKIGLVQIPQISVTIIGYPPIYVLDDVRAPGQYQFHVGLTVLQCLAMAGGEYRDEKNGTAPDNAAFVGALRSIDNSILRTEIRIARLAAEMSGAKEIAFEQRYGRDGEAATAIYLQEKAIFDARANLLKRQSKSYSDLRNLLSAEIETLEKKAEGANADVESVERELRNVKSMVEKGIALPSRQGDLERLARSYYTGRLDITTAIMRARQGITEASRNLEGLYDRQRTDVTAELQTERANLDQLLLRRDTTQKQLLDALSQGGTASDKAAAGILTFTVSRIVDGKSVQQAATEDTMLQPGDVVRVMRKLPQIPGAAAEGDKAIQSRVGQ